MPEYFDISLIGRKTSTSKSKIAACLKHLSLFEGDNNSNLFGGEQIIVSCFDDDESDFDEVNIGIPKHRFHKETFNNELKQFTNFINYCFVCNYNFKYALCSYEINGYLIGGIKKIEDFDNEEFLKRFPIIYKRSSLELPSLVVNIEAQEIF